MRHGLQRAAQPLPVTLDEEFRADLPGGLLEAIDGVPTPFYVLDVARVRRRARSFRHAVRAVFPTAGIAYPYKANPIAEVARAAVGEYGFAEVATHEELRLAMGHGCPSTRCLLGGVGKREAVLRAAVAGGATLKVDSVAELERLGAIWGSVEVHDHFRLLLRVALPAGDRESRFGLTPAEASEALREGEGWRTRLRGVHFHAGTGLQDPASHVSAARWCEPILREIEAHSDARPVLDIGGGYPNCVDREVTPTAGRFLGAVASLLEDRGWGTDTVEIICEPGRITVERAGYLVASVIERRETNGRSSVIVDAGSTLAGGSRSTVKPGRSALFLGSGSPVGSPWDVYGNLPYDEDRLAEGAVLIDRHLQDVAIIGDVGGYQLAAAAPWMQKLPAVHVLDGSRLGLLRAEQPLHAFS